MSNWMWAGHTILVRTVGIAAGLFLVAVVARGMVYGDTSSLSDSAHLAVWGLIFLVGVLVGWVSTAVLMRMHRHHGTWLPRDLYYLLYGREKSRKPDDQ